MNLECDRIHYSVCMCDVRGGWSYPGYLRLEWENMYTRAWERCWVCVCMHNGQPTSSILVMTGGHSYAYESSYRTCIYIYIYIYIAYIYTIKGLFWGLFWGFIYWSLLWLWIYECGNDKVDGLSHTDPGTGVVHALFLWTQMTKQSLIHCSYTHLMQSNI